MNDWPALEVAKLQACIGGRPPVRFKWLHVEPLQMPSDIVQCFRRPIQNLDKASVFGSLSISPTNESVFHHCISDNSNSFHMQQQHVKAHQVLQISWPTKHDQLTCITKNYISLYICACFPAYRCHAKPTCCRSTSRRMAMTNTFKLIIYLQMNAVIF